MLFNSLDFAVFLPVVFLLYWFVFNRSLRLQNMFLLFASMFFYAWWDWRYLGLVFFSAGIDYVAAILMDRTDDRSRRKALLALSLVTNLGLLGFFKYYDFFVVNFDRAFTLFGHPLGLQTLKLVLPVGISFYTFQSLSYTIDVYRKQLEPCRDPWTYFPFVLFFPQLMAGPIERAHHLLPQFRTPRLFNESKARDGLRQILWGLFKKVVIADNCSWFVDRIYSDPAHATGSAVLIGTVLFSFQIYADFSGYSDIALGSARLIGFELMRNFAFPLLARDVGEFWRRWHISLNTWFRDYLYIPLGGSRGGRWGVARNTMAIFLVSGFWHGANWTFVIWGFINACYFLPSILQRKHRRFLNVVAEHSTWPSLSEFGHMFVTFFMITFTRIFFRSADVGTAWTMIKHLFSPTILAPLTMPHRTFLIECFGLAGLMLAVEYFNRRKQHGLEIAALPLWQRWLSYGAIAWMIVQFAPMNANQFIYFQF